ncbi:MAG: hypothetical protein WCI20_04220 [bacterium]
MTLPTSEWDEESPATKPKPGRSTPAPVGCLVFVLLSLVVLLAFVTFGIQTKIGCEWVADSVRRQTGLDVAIGGASLAWPLDLYLTDVQTKPSTTPLGSFKAREIRIGWRWGGRFDMMLSGARLEVMKIADGWVPTPFAKIGELSDVRETVLLVSEEIPLASLDIRDSSVIWNGPDGERLASSEGLGLSMRRVTLGDRPYFVFEVTSRIVRRVGGLKGLNVRRLWMSGNKCPYLEVEYSGMWDGDDVALKDWWATPPGAVKRGMGHEK